MEELFKILLIRNAEGVDAEEAASTLSDSTYLQTELDRISGEDGREKIMERLDAFADSSDFYGRVDQVPNGPGLLGLHQDLLALDEPSAAAIEALIQDLLDQDAAELTGDQGWESTKERLSDSLLTMKLLRSQQAGPINDMAAILRSVHFLEQYAAGTVDVTDAGAIRQLLQIPLVLPILPRLNLRTPLPEVEVPPVSELPDPDKLDKAGRQLGLIDGALRELSQVPPRHFKTVTLFSGESSGGGQGNRGGGIFSRLFGANNSSLLGSIDASKTSMPRLSLTDEGRKEVSDDTQTLLTAYKMDLSRDSLPQVMARLDGAKAQSVRDIQPFTAMYPHGVVDFLLPGLDRRFGDWELPPFTLPEAEIVPRTHGNVTPIGEGELLVVRQHILRYEAGEVAHIENVLKGESKVREHRRREFSEQILVEESEINREEERDLQTTERFELSREVQETVKEEFSVEGGLKVKVKPSPAVVIEANAKVAYKNSRESARKQASNYAREIVEKSVNKLSEKIRKQQTLRIINEVEEKNTHTLNNITGDGHVIGVYQWVDKIYEAQIYRYGGRTMYDFIVPEPAAFLVGALKEDLARESGLREPAPFTLSAGQITEGGYLYYANKYHATGITPPPEFTITRSVSFSSTGGDSESETDRMAQKQDIAVPEGYQAVQAHITSGFVGGQLFVSVGRQYVLYEGVSGSKSVNLDLEIGTIPVGMVANGTPLFSVAVEIICSRTDRAFLNWQIETHAEIQQAYLNERAKYEEALAQAAINRGVVIEGNNPGINREIESTELKKHCISILTNQHYDLFNGIEIGGHGIPQVNVPVAGPQGEYIRFFEHAFEWQLMSFVFYPYFWGRKLTWLDRVRYENNDPEFAEFVKAGAARVLIPVREHFEAAVEHFMRTGEVWEGGPLPEITDPDYLPIVKEIQERTGAPGDEVPVDDPWPVRVPTRLVKLREDGSLPRWVRDDDGNWLPSELADELADEG